jgi:hypothetical protein
MSFFQGWEHEYEDVGGGVEFYLNKTSLLFTLPCRHIPVFLYGSPHQSTLEVLNVPPIIQYMHVGDADGLRYSDVKSQPRTDVPTTTPLVHLEKIDMSVPLYAGVFYYRYYLYYTFIVFTCADQLFTHMEPGLRRALLRYHQKFNAMLSSIQYSSALTKHTPS